MGTTIFGNTHLNFVCFLCLLFGVTRFNRVEFFVDKKMGFSKKKVLERSWVSSFLKLTPFTDLILNIVWFCFFWGKGGAGNVNINIKLYKTIIYIYLSYTYQIYSFPNRNQESVVIMAKSIG